MRKAYEEGAPRLTESRNTCNDSIKYDTLTQGRDSGTTPRKSRFTFDLNSQSISPQQGFHMDTCRDIEKRDQTSWTLEASRPLVARIPERPCMPLRASLASHSCLPWGPRYFRPAVQPHFAPGVSCKGTRETGARCRMRTFLGHGQSGPSPVTWC